jgi:hypothetical protein
VSSSPLDVHLDHYDGPLDLLLTTEALEDYGLKADFELSHPKMGLLANEAAGQAAAGLAGKR